MVINGYGSLLTVINGYGSLLNDIETEVTCEVRTKSRFTEKKLLNDINGYWWLSMVMDGYCVLSVVMDGYLVKLIVINGMDGCWVIAMIMNEMVIECYWVLWMNIEW